MSFKIHIQNRAPKLPEISKSIIAQINVSETPDKIITAKEFSYKASDGDIIRKRIIDGISIIEIELSETNISNLELLCETNSFNTTTTTTRRTHIKLEGNLCDVARMTLGFYRNYLINDTELNALGLKGIRTTYEVNGKTIYESLLKCPPENKDLIISHIKKIGKPVIEWF